MRRSLVAFLGILTFLLPCRVEAADDMVKKMAALLNSRFPGENFIPVPSGSQGRWTPKSIWCYQDVKKQAEGKTTRKAWIRFSSGQLLYPDATAPIQREKVAIGTREDDVESGLALAASLAGVLSSIQVNADLSAKLKKSLHFSVEVAEAEIHWVDLEDLRMSRGLVFKTVVEQFNGRRMAKGPLPPTVVVNAALWVSGGRIKASVRKGADVTADVELEGVLKALGFNVTRLRTTEDVVAFPSGGYLAVSALEMNADALISKSSQPGAVEFNLTPDTVSTPTEDRDASQRGD